MAFVVFYNISLSLTLFFILLSLFRVLMLILLNLIKICLVATENGVPNYDEAGVVAYIFGMVEVMVGCVRRHL